MLFHAHRKEGIAACTGALLLAVLAIAIGLPQVSASLPAFIKGGVGLLVIEIAIAAILFVGLACGLLRHRDTTPLLFAILGLGVLLMYSLGNFPQFLPLLCAASFIIASVWNLFLPSADDSSRKTEAPRLDEFLDQKLLPTEKDGENDK